MQKMYEDYGDIAEFRLVYITEAHAKDSSWPVKYAKKLGITKHKTFGERCSVAERLHKDKSLTIPTLIDGMDNATNKAYKAHPDRIYLVRKDGRLAVAGKRGPFGFKPALNKSKVWLASYKETGEEPTMEDVAEKEAEVTSAGSAASDGASNPASWSTVLGEWNMATEFRGGEIPAVMTLRANGGKLVGVWSSQGQEMEMTDIKVAGGSLSFKRSMGGGPVLNFKGKVNGQKVSGKYTGPFGELKCAGDRSAATSAHGRS